MSQIKVLVTYYTQTGNTKRVAEAICDEISDPKEIKALADVESLDGYDIVFVGFPIMAFSAAKPAKDFLEAHAAGKRVALFMTHASPEDQDLLGEWITTCKAVAADAELVGTFNCQGELSQQVADLLAGSDDPGMRAFAEGRSETLGQPDEARLQKARAFAREIIETVKG